MKLRYIETANNLYIPQYQSNSPEWIPFTKDMMKGDMLKVCEAIGSVSDTRSSFMGLPLKGHWYFDDNHKNKSVRNAVFFTKKLYVMAFIGAAQHWWGDFDKTEVNWIPVNLEDDNK